MQCDPVAQWRKGVVSRVILSLSIGAPLDVTSIDGILRQSGFEIGFYGAPNGFALDGGRVVADSWESYCDVLDYLSSREIAFNLCCNTVLGPNEVRLDDRVTTTLSAAHRPGNGVIVSRHWLAREIRRAFPDFRLVFSSIGTLTEPWEEGQLFAEYDVVVCPVERTNDFSLVRSPSHWAQVEVFLNNECIDFGQRCLAHYRHNSLTNIGHSPPNGFLCPNLCNAGERGAPIQPSLADLRRYIALGVRRFKLIERTAQGQDFRTHFERLSDAATSEA